jgi:regulator of sigma E protease
LENREPLNHDAGRAPADHAPNPLPPEPSVDADTDEAPPSLRGWIIANSFALTVVACVIAFVFIKFRLEEILAIGKAFVGLSFVVFVHELGHFLVAKWCDVHVTTFSIGFGPAVPGCAFHWGETMYKLSLFPLGGYVQMVGQVDGDEGSDGSEDYPRSYRNKSVGQRMAIISAGVIMNVILAVVCFVIVFEGPGKERPAAVVGKVDTGAPAFKYGIRTGAKIVQIGDVQDPHFEDLMVTVMGSRYGEKVRFVAQTPGGGTEDLMIEPRLERNDTKPMIGITYPEQLQLQTRRAVDPDMKAPAVPGSAADRASQPFHFGDRIIATSDPDDPARAVKALPDDPRYPGKGRRDFFEFARRMQLFAAEPVVIRVERQVDGKATTADITVPPMFGLSLGVRMQMGPISALRDDSPAARAGLVARDPAGSREGDLILSVEVLDANGKVIRWDEKNLDPERLPSQLKQWAQRLDQAGFKGDRKVKLEIRRHRVSGGQQFQVCVEEVPWDDSWRFDETVPMNLNSPMAIPELGLAYQVKTAVAEVLPGVVKENPLQAGDVIKNFRYTYQGVGGEEKTGSWLSDNLEEGQWARATIGLLRIRNTITKIELKVERNKAIEEVSLVPVRDQSWPMDDRGWLLMPDTRLQKADSFSGAIALGMKDTYSSMTQVFQNLRGMITGRVSVKNLGGPVMIANVAYRVAGYDFWEFIFFLGLISINLAVVNFLPIPVLDGGHMVFLLYEKLRGRPASEAVRVGATYAGLALILSLFVLVMWLDVSRLF